MRKSLSTISIFLTIFLSAQSFIVFGETQSNLGSYFLFGEYNDEEILWRCIEEDEEKLLLFSDKVLCDKPFDVPGTNTEGSHSRGLKRDEAASNFWEDSTIRAWLNSYEEYGNITYPCGVSPSIESNYSYGTENGFLHDFSESERALIQEVSQKSILDTPDYEVIQSNGTENFSNKYGITTAISNYDSAYSHQVKDKVFLLDVKQIYSAYELSYHKTSKPFWLRTPKISTNNNGIVRYIINAKDDACVSDSNADISLGIRPALYIPKNGIIKIGSGTKEDPYKVASVNVSSNSVTATVNIPKYSGEGYVIATINSEPNKIGEITMANITFNSEKRIDKEIKFENVTPKPGDILNIFIWDTNMKPVTEKFTYTFN